MVELFEMCVTYQNKDNYDVFCLVFFVLKNALMNFTRKLIFWFHDDYSILIRENN